MDLRMANRFSLISSFPSGLTGSLNSDPGAGAMWFLMGPACAGSGELGIVGRHFHFRGWPCLSRSSFLSQFFRSR